MRTCAVNYPRLSPSIIISAIAVPIALVILVLFIISLAVAVTFHHRNKRSSKSLKVEGHAMIVRNRDQSPTTRYYRADQIRLSQNFSNQSDCQRASYIAGAYVINCIGPYENDNACGEGGYCDPADCEEGLRKQLKNSELREVFIENIG